MSLLSRLFRRSTPENAPSAVPSSRPSTTLAKSVPAQQTAVEQEPYSPALLARAASAENGRAAQRRIAGLIDAGEISFETVVEQCPNRDVLLAIAASAKDPQPLERLLTSATPAQWLEWALHSASAQVRQRAAEKIDDPGALRRLLKDARGKDKNVYRIAKTKCDAIAAAEREAAAQQARIVALSESIERQVHKPYDNLFVPAVEHLASQWQDVDPIAPADIRNRAQHALERCHDIISEHVRDLAAKAAAANAIQNAQQQRESILAEWPKWIAQFYSLDTFESTDRERAESALKQLADRWRDTLAYKEPSRAEQEKFDRLHGRTEQLLLVIAEHGTLKAQLAKLQSSDIEATHDVRPLKRILDASDFELTDESRTLMDEASAVIARIDQTRTERVAKVEHDERQIESLIRKALGALRQGRSGGATGLRRAIEEKLQAGVSLSPRLSNQLQQLDARLKELQDWKHYAVAPKRLELIEQMEALIGAEQDPDDVAEQIKELQGHWRTLSRGTPDESDAEWVRFKAAADKAYEPCKAHFKAQAEMRAANLERRKQVVSELAQFEATHDWEQPIWSEVMNRLRSARDTWRNAHPTDRAATKATQAQFDAIMQSLNGRLDAEFERNVQRKRRLIAQAQALTTAGDLRRAIDDIKSLQADWKEVGLVPRSQDQALWLEFRTHCDAIFQRSKADRAEFAATLDSHKTRAAAICEELENIAASDNEARQPKRIQELQAEFESIESLPRADAAQLRRRFQRAINDIEQSQRRGMREREVQAWYDVLAISASANNGQLADLERREDEAASARAAAEHRISQLDGVPRNVRDAVRAKLDVREYADASENELALRRLCIRAELLTGMPTPESDAHLRREHQLQSLVQDFGRARASTQEQLQMLVLDWIAVGPVNLTIYEELTARLRVCVRAALTGGA